MKQFIRATALLMVLSTVAMAQAEHFVIQSHRGAGEGYPENTLEAFEMAWKLGTVPEADLRATRDGVIVAFHDENFARVVKDADETLKKKGVKDLTLAELKKLDVGSFRGDEFKGQRIPAVAEAFARMKGHPERRLYLDFKFVDLNQLADEVKKHDVAQQVILASTKYDIIRSWKRLLPDSQTLLWMGGTEDKLRKRIEELKKNQFFDCVTQLQLHIHVDKSAGEGAGDEIRFAESDDLIKDVAKELKSRNILFQALPMNATDAKVYRRLLDLGVQSFATDHPQLTLDVVKEYSATRPALP